MQNEVIRSLADALQDTGFGVEIQLASLPVDVGDVAPSAVSVVDGTRDDYAAKGDMVPTGVDIRIFVHPDGPTRTMKSPPKTEYSFGMTPVAMFVAHRGDVPPAQQLADVGYVLRAIVLTVKAYFAQGQEARTRNDICVLETESLTYGLIQDDGVGALGAVAFNVKALDKRAQRTY